MPTVLRREGYEIVIYFNDHVPPYVHAFKGAGEAKIHPDPVVVRQVWKMRKRVALRARRIIFENREYLLQKWTEIHGE
jgi:Domain of unknown function (DUF4160)